MLRECLSGKGQEAVRWERGVQTVTMRQGQRSRHGLDIRKGMHVDSTISYGG